MNHLGIYCKNTVDKKKLIQGIEENVLLSNFYNLEGMRGEVLSSIAIDTFIEEEFKHSNILITSEANSTLEEMSSGQQRMALANYIFKQKPEFVILDDIQGNVDNETLSHLHQLLDHRSKECLYIQIFSRIDDVLPYISKVVELDISFEITGVYTQQEFIAIHANQTKPHYFQFPQLLSEIPYFNPLLTMENVSVAYGTKPVLTNINWSIKPGEFWELRGPIGSGKSTLLSMIIGDNPKAFGQDIYLFGRKKGSGESVWDIKKNIGYFYPKMMQLFSRETSIENMIVSGFYDSIGLYVKPTDTNREIAREWIETLGADYKNKTFQKLSPGQQRIVLVIRAMVKQPPLLILDEPTVGLDDYNIQLFISMVQEIAHTKKIAIIFVSHRKEVGLKADNILDLIPSENGSFSRITKK